MSSNLPAPSGETSTTGATVVISHRVRAGSEPAYDAWLEEIGPLCRNAPGHVNWQIVRPVPGLTSTYSVIIRFDSRHSLESWMKSESRRGLIEKVRPILASDDHYQIRTGLDFWFDMGGSAPRPPLRWKQFLITWSAIFPLSLTTPLVVLPLVRWLGSPPIRVIDSLLISGMIVFLMTYVVMPRYTRLLRRWLSAGRET